MNTSIQWFENLLGWCILAGQKLETKEGSSSYVMNFLALIMVGHKQDRTTFYQIWFQISEPPSMHSGIDIRYPSLLATIFKLPLERKRKREKKDQISSNLRYIHRHLKNNGMLGLVY